MYIIAIDPGGTTGIAIWNGRHFEFDEFGGSVPHWTLWDMLSSRYTTMPGNQALQIVCEDFDWRLEEADRAEREDGTSAETKKRTKIDYTAAELVGVVKLFAQSHDASLTLQKAALAKGGFFGTEHNDKIKRLSLWRPGMRHAMDALRHLLYYRVFTLQETYILDRLKEVTK